MELGWVVRDLPGSTLIPYCSNSVAKPRSSCTRRTSAGAGASSLGHRICRMWEACSKLPFIHDLRGRRTGRSSANGAPSHVIPTAQVAEGFFRNPEHPRFLLLLWVLVRIISHNQRVEKFSCTMYRAHPPLDVALLEGVPLTLTDHV